MRFFSDNAAAACPPVMQAMIDANCQSTAYDGDEWSKRLDGAFSDLFEAPVRALWIGTGTAANGLALAALCPPHGSIVCHHDSHVHNDEGGAPEFYTHGAKLLLAGGEGAKLTPETISALLGATRRDVHQAQPAALTITNATEYGRVYSPDEVAAIGDLCRARGLGLHMDGARFANAVAAAGYTPAEMTWRAGVDVLSFGFIKNGGLSAEALIFFRTELACATLYRRKRSGHLLSKGRYFAAQILSMLDGDVWLHNARAANHGATRIAAAAGAGSSGEGRLLHAVEANEIFISLTPDEAAALRAQGFDFYDWGPGEARLVVAWDQDTDDIDTLAAAIAAL